uniref:Uncharacterized protein n=1 Tax=Opuntia streptacantha TaxID=393608 RepID=A0A7C8YH94_OPUST
MPLLVHSEILCRLLNSKALLLNQYTALSSSRSLKRGGDANGFLCCFFPFFGLSVFLLLFPFYLFLSLFDRKREKAGQKKRLRFSSDLNCQKIQWVLVVKKNK